MPVNTRSAPRRAVEYRCLGCLKKDLDAVEAAHASGTLRATGNWSPGQVLEHCAIFFRCALDGFPDTGRPVPWWMRWLATTFFKNKALAGSPPPPGMKIPSAAAYLSPRDTVDFSDGLAQVRRVVERLESGERMTHSSPLFGSLTHDEWMTLQLGHSRLHMSFLDLGGPASA